MVQLIEFSKNKLRSEMQIIFIEFGIKSVGNRVGG